MLDSKFIYTLLAVVLVVLAMCNFNATKVLSNESFGMLPSFAYKVDRTAAVNQQAAKRGDFFSVPGTYQAILNPRMYSGEYGATIRYNMPDLKNQAVPTDPLTFGEMTSENYVSGKSEGFCGSCNPPSCNKDGTSMNYHSGAPLMKANFADGNYNEMIDSANLESSYPNTIDMVPVGDMTSVDAMGDVQQPIVYDRFMYANRSKRLSSLGDMIRGDVPIAPCAVGWFRPSVQPNIDLQQGAMNVMGGYDNTTAQKLAALVNITSGGADTTIGGINMSANQFTTSLGAAQNDVMVTSFP